MDRFGVLGSALVKFLGLAAVIAVLYFGKGFLIPFALAVLLSLMLAPLVNRLQHWGWRRLPAVVAVVVLLFGLIGWAGWVVTGQVARIGRELPRYRENIAKKISSVHGPLGKAVEHAVGTVQEIVHETGPQARKNGPEPMKVEVVRPRPAPLEILTGIIATVVTTLGTGAVVILLVVFFLVYQADIRDRLIHAFGVARVNPASETLDEATLRVGRYLLLQTTINVFHGVLMTAGLLVLGVPNALLWGLMAALLRYVPYLGPVIAAALPLLFSLAVFEGWTRPILLGSFILTLELVSNNVIEPLVYGNGTGLSPMGVVISAIFWAWLWGGTGLILAVPITASLVTLGRHVPSLRFLNLLFGSHPDLEPEVRLYHRLLARDSEAAAELVDHEKKDKPLEELADRLLVPALALAEQDRHFGELEEDRATHIWEAMRQIIEDLPDSAALPPGDAPSVLILPASDPADELCGSLLAALLAPHGVRAEVLSGNATTGEKAERAERLRPDVLCISALPPSAVVQTRYLYKRLRRRLPRQEIVIGVWKPGENVEHILERIAPDRAIRLTSSMAEACRRILELTGVRS